MSEEGIKKFFAVARERETIRLKREEGLPRPWSTDPIFQREYFCNVDRENDKTTKWFRESIRDRLNKSYCLNPAVILLGIVAFRWFNRIETWDAILGSGRSVEDIFARWDSNWIRQEIADHAKAPYVTGAYIIKTPDGMNKVEGVLWCIDQFQENIKAGAFTDLIEGRSSMKEACNALQDSPYLGNFMAWQICSDARKTKLLENAPDRNTWAQPGPGSTRGLGRVFHNDPEHFKYGSARDEQKMLELMQYLAQQSHDPEYWPWDPLAVIGVSHFCCEWDKYCRAEEGGRMKRKYNGTHKNS